MKKKILIVFGLLIIMVSVFYFIKGKKQDITKDKPNTDTTSFDNASVINGIIFSGNKGIYSNGGNLSYLDLEKRKIRKLCLDVNCQHIAGMCPANVEDIGMVYMTCLQNNLLLFSEGDDELVAYKSDIDGKNRKKIATEKCMNIDRTKGWLETKDAIYFVVRSVVKKSEISSSSGRVGSDVTEMALWRYEIDNQCFRKIYTGNEGYVSGGSIAYELDGKVYFSFSAFSIPVEQMYDLDTGAKIVDNEIDYYSEEDYSYDIKTGKTERKDTFAGQLVDGYIYRQEITDDFNGKNSVVKYDSNNKTVERFEFKELEKDEKSGYPIIKRFSDCFVTKQNGIIFIYYEKSMYIYNCIVFGIV